MVRAAPALGGAAWAGRAAPAWPEVAGGLEALEGLAAFGAFGEMGLAIVGTPGTGCAPNGPWGIHHATNRARAQTGSLEHGAQGLLGMSGQENREQRRRHSRGDRPSASDSR